MKPKVIAPSLEVIDKTLHIIQKYNVNTICFASKCPNLAECFARGSATFMILGNICTRNCKFCNVSTAKPNPLNPDEIENISNAIKYLGLEYVVITSVDRDDLDDFGSNHFFQVIQNIPKNVKVEILTPDFNGDINALNLMANSNAYKLAHNIETTHSLHKRLKPKSDYNLSLKVLEYYSKFKTTKSSIMVGFGEQISEIKTTFKDLLNAGVSQLTIGQYLQPTPKHYPVKKYYLDEEFDELQSIAKNMGFKAVVSGKLVRSSYYAESL